MTEPGMPVMLQQVGRARDGLRMVSTNASVASPLTPLRFWFISLPYQSWTSGPTFKV